MLSFSVGIRAFVIGLSQIFFFFFSFLYNHKKNIIAYEEMLVNNRMVGRHPLLTDLQNTDISEYVKYLIPVKYH